MGTALLWRLTQGPLDITGLTRRWTPIDVAAGTPATQGQDTGPARAAGRLDWDNLSIAWNASRHEGGFVLLGRKLRILRRDGTAAATLEHARVVLNVPLLITGRIAPRVIEARGAQVGLRQSPSGDVQLDLPGARNDPQGRDIVLLTALERVQFDQIRASLRLSEPTHANAAPSFTLDLPALEGRRERAFRRQMLWDGSFSATISAPGSPPLHLSGSATPGQQGADWRLSASSFEPQMFSPLVPGLARWHVPLSVDLSGVETEGRIGGVLRRRDGLAITRLTGTARLAAGEILQETGAPLAVDGGGMALSVAPTRPGRMDAQLSLSDAWLSLKGAGAAPTRFSADARFALSDLLRPARISGTAHVAGSAFAVGEISAIWPTGMMRGARRWVSKNLLAGKGSGLSISAQLQGDHGWQSLQPVDMKGHLHLDDVTLVWLEGMPAAEHVVADLGFARPDELSVAIHEGTQAADDRPHAPRLALSDGTALIDGLYVHDQTGHFTLHLAGDLDAYRRLLSVPRLHLLSRHPLPFRDMSGPVQADLALSLPLETHIPDDSIHLKAQAAFHDVHLGDFLLTRDLNGGTGTMLATEAGLDVDGSALVGGVPTTAHFHESFRHNADTDVVERVHAVSDFTPAAFARADLGAPDLFDGHARLTSDYIAQAGGHAEVALDLDLGETALSLPLWVKAAGKPASAQARIVLQDGTITSLDGMQARGAGLSLSGHAIVENARVAGIAVEDFSIGRSAGDARILFSQDATKAAPSANPGGAPLRVIVNARTLDLAPLFHDAPPATTKATRPEPARARRTQRDWILDLRAGRVFFSQDDALGGVSAHLEDHAGRLDFATIDSAQPARMRLVMQPQGSGRHLVMTTQDLGTVLTHLAGVHRIGGGNVRLEGMLGDSHTSGLPPFEGTFSGENVAFLRPPDALTIATHLAPFDRNAADQRHFEVRDFSLPLRFSDSVATIHDGHLGNRAFGVTVGGTIDTGHSSLDLRGTLVPVFAVNAAPGLLPGLGKLLVPEKGGGFLAATFTVKGGFDAPAVHVNPFSMLLPGILRDLAK